MKILDSKLFLLLGTIILLCNCSPNEPVEPDTQPVYNNDSIDYIPKMITPLGGRLLPAEEGPPLSVFGYPNIDVSTFELQVTGLVDSSYSITWDDILQLPNYQTDIMLMYCVDGWEVWGSWLGVRIGDLLDMAHLKEGAEYVLFRSADGGYSTSLPISYLKKYNALLAYNVNGSYLPVNNGFPLRLVAFGKFGYKWIKWVNKLEIIESSQAGYWESQGYTDLANVPVERRQFYEKEDAKPLEY